MTNAEQWLADMEAKAKAATPGAWHIIEADDERFMSAVYVATTPADATPGETPENVIAVTLLQSPRVASSQMKNGTKTPPSSPQPIPPSSSGW